MSSLQRALVNEAENRPSAAATKPIKFGSNGSGVRRGGAFENSFARGLDISELLSTNTNKNAANKSNQTSAAEELLRIREGERRQRQIQEEEEAKMEEALRKRLVSLKDGNRKGKERARSSFEDALVRMHGTDDKAASILSRKNTSGKSRKHSGSRRNSKGNKSSLVAKKSRRSKF